MTKHDLTRLGTVIYDRREALGRTTTDVAKRIGIDRRTLGRIQLGHIRTSPNILTKIARELDLPAAELHALAGYETVTELPELEGFLHLKHRSLKDTDVKELRGHLDYLLARSKQRDDEQQGGRP